MNILVFRLEAQDYAVPLHVVRETVRAVEITPLPGAPGVVEGVIDYRGALIPVFSLRRRFALEERGVEPTHNFIVVEENDRTAALHVDAVHSLAEVDDEDVREAAALVRGGAHVAGVVEVNEGLVLLYDVSTFLSEAEAETLDGALRAYRHAPAGA